MKLENLKNVRPRNQMVLIQKDTRADRTDSGIYVPTAGKGDLKTGTVVAVSPAIEDLKMATRLFTRRT